ncbi:MAG: ABC transporter ATP-binding protein, partial [Atopobium sp.]|nr:ABC transporter ATP-binding protein [Atopobium sp.]
MKTEVKNSATTARTSRRSALTIMLRLVGLVRPLAGFMILAILMGVLGNLAATFISIFGAYALLSAMGFASSSPMALLFGGMLLFALVRGLLRYAEQECNHFIAFKLLALIRDRVFTALRKLAPAKLEVKNKGNLMSVITSDIELLEVFYAHTISPICIAVVFCIVMVWFIAGTANWILGVIALVSYLVVGVAIPLAMSKRSEQDSAEARDLAGKLSTVTLDNLRGLDEILQYNTGKQMIKETSQLADQLSDRQQAVKKAFGVNDAVTSTVILLSGLVMFFSSFYMAYHQQIFMNEAFIVTITLMSSFGPVVALAALGTTLTSTFAAGNRVLDILDEKPLVEDVVDQKDISYEGVHVSELSFAYDNEQILDNISVDIPTDKIVGIVGKSGSGKSTLLKLLMRFWPAT